MKRETLIAAASVSFEGFSDRDGCGEVRGEEGGLGSAAGPQTSGL